MTGTSIATAAAAVSAGARDFATLLKPRVMSLVLLTGLAGLLAAPGELHPVIALVALLCIALGAGASGAINMWYEHDIDALMSRTRHRPIPQGRIEPATPLGSGVVLAVASVVVMGLVVNFAAAGVLALTIGFYVFVYTMWLKRRTPQNIVIGGAAGAFPPAALSPWLIGFSGWLYAAGVTVLSAAFIGHALLVLRDTTHGSARRMFGFSILYLFLLFALLVVDRFVVAG